MTGPSTWSAGRRISRYRNLARHLIMNWLGHMSRQAVSAQDWMTSVPFRSTMGPASTASRGCCGKYATLSGADHPGNTQVLNERAPVAVALLPGA